MRYNPKKKLKVGQVKDLRTSGAVRRRAANSYAGPDSTDNVGITPEQAEADDFYRRYHQITYSKAYRPIGHIRPQTPAVVMRGGVGHYVMKTARPDGADRVQPFKKKVAIQKRPARG